MKRIFTVMLCLMLLMGALPVLAADGTFEGSSHGFNGPLKVSVTVAGGAITAIDVTEHVESAGVTDEIITGMPDAIIAAQSTAIDALSGATYTSNAIKAAVKNALTGAGIEGFDEAPTYDETDAALSVDVVVIGGGIAGLTAAIEAKEAGANVVILEKLYRLGGSSVTSGGIVYATNSPMNGEYDNDPADMVAYYQQRANGVADEALLTYAAQHSGETVAFLMDLGVEFASVTPAGLSPAVRAHNCATSGAGVIRPLIERAKALEIPIYRETAATKLITNDAGAVVGVEAEGKHARYTFEAKSVVMATGGYDMDHALLAKYSPDAAAATGMSSVGNTGDAIAMAEAVGAQMLFRGGVIGFRAVNPVMPFLAMPNTLVFMGTLGVTDEGVRFVNEVIDYPVYFTAMAQTGRDNFFYIFDEASAAMCDAPVAQGLGFKADTIEGLAEAAGMDPAVLRATFDRYQELGKAGVDEDFGKPGIAPLSDEGPYYAIKAVKATIGSMGGLMINTEAEVLGADGAPVAGLYAAGECANGQFFDKEYPASGTMLMLSTTYGRVAGRNAAK